MDEQKNFGEKDGFAGGAQVVSGGGGGAGRWKNRPTGRRSLDGVHHQTEVAIIRTETIDMEVAFVCCHPAKQLCQLFLYRYISYFTFEAGARHSRTNYEKRSGQHPIQLPNKSERNLYRSVPLLYGTILKAQLNVNEQPIFSNDYVLVAMPPPAHRDLQVTVQWQRSTCHR